MMCEEEEISKGITDDSGFTERTPKMQKAHEVTILLDMEIIL